MQQALRLVEAGADSNTHVTPEPPPSLLHWCKSLLRRAPLSTNSSPTAFLTACGPDIPQEDTELPPGPDAPQLVQAMLHAGADPQVRDAVAAGVWGGSEGEG